MGNAKTSQPVGAQGASDAMARLAFVGSDGADRLLGGGDNGDIQELISRADK